MSILSFIWNSLLKIPIFNLLILFEYFTGNLGISIILLTLVLRLILLPANIPSIKMSTKREELKAEMDKIKDKYDDKTKQAEKQMELYKKHGVNPVAGCLPNIFQFGILIALYRVFMDLVNNNLGSSVLYFDFLQSVSINTEFLYLNLFEADPYFILPVVAAAVQFFMTKTLMPGNKEDKEIAEETPQKSDDMATAIQGQMMYMAPIMTLIIGFKLPSGLVLYWFVSSLFSLVQNVVLKKRFKEQD